MKVWVITTVNYEYNDEYSTTPEGGGGDPKLVFTDPAAARAKLDELQFAEFKASAGDIESYECEGLAATCSDMDAFLAIVNEGRGGDVCPSCKAEGSEAVTARGRDQDAHCSLCGKAWPDEITDEQPYIPAGVTDDQLRRLMPLISVPFYEIHEVELVS
jgi:hypothetical protein